MVSRSILAVAAAAMFLGAEAGPCRPTTATSLADSETSSIVLPVSESTTLTTLIETTPTAVAETTSTVLDEVTPTTLAASTTTSEAPNCVETQVVSNPGFDDNNDLSPWTSSGSLTDNGAHSAPNAVSFGFQYGQGSNQIAQNLPTLDGDYRLSYRWSVPTVVGLQGFSCTIQPKIGSDALPAANPYERSGWNSESETWSSGGTSVVGVAISFKIDCSGEYDDLTILLDDVTLTRDCNGAIRGD
ncbi:hypothetical protein FVEN_g4443 [Fusarium venenatum]|uniref:CBM-cenC domain-containing protein n=1 Tax=Fusarium venenatum TaxID=56646 RepID=A0A2L2TRB0_9HYPO|nr:uncharacterized protein FVRRES_02668 [Fusarium venenatum]KAG8358010.1 hypothetical protein FVEN_g4443 [Fusarium venenatum]KAH7004245.1 hypothetical protein EDB82DRAFT_44945 [Fusarium venenatum]CEI66156.1 unnamed protein product [Fusarium venenatum]